MGSQTSFRRNERARLPRPLAAAAVATSLTVLYSAFSSGHLAFMNPAPLFGFGRLDKQGAFVTDSGFPDKVSQTLHSQALSQVEYDRRIGVGRTVDVLKTYVAALFNNRPGSEADLPIFSEEDEILDGRIFWLNGHGTYNQVIPRQLVLRRATATRTSPVATPAVLELLGGRTAPRFLRRARASRAQITRRAMRSMPGLPQSCKDDFECNDGKANFPLQCCELFLLGSFCCKPDDSESTAEQRPAFAPLPIPIEDPWQQGR